MTFAHKNDGNSERQCQHLTSSRSARPHNINNNNNNNNNDRLTAFDPGQPG